jgi:hypothetical protein
MGYPITNISFFLVIIGAVLLGLGNDPKYTDKSQSEKDKMKIAGTVLLCLGLFWFYMTDYS